MEESAQDCRISAALTELSLQALLKEAGPDRARVEDVLREVAQGLLEARLVVDAEQWYRVSSNDRFAVEFLNGVLGTRKRSWDSSRLLGGSPLAALRAINMRAHAWSTTKGAAKYRALVVQAQGGEFCSMCGRLENLAVDHVDPVSMGGSSDSVSNMQLLCQDCNLGKTNLRDRLLPTAIGLRTSPVIGPRLRFKHLLLDSIEVDGRTRGVCSCGRRADEAELRVEVRALGAAANLLTLITRCSGCQESS